MRETARSIKFRIQTPSLGIAIAMAVVSVLVGILMLMDRKSQMR